MIRRGGGGRFDKHAWPQMAPAATDPHSTHPRTRCAAPLLQVDVQAEVAILDALAGSPRACQVGRMRCMQSMQLFRGHPVVASCA